MRIAQLANFVGPASGGIKTAINALGAGYADAGVQRLLLVPGPVDARESTPHGDVVQFRAPRVGGGYRLIVEPWRVVAALEQFDPTSIEVSDKSTLLPVTRWARRNDVGSVLFSHERLDLMLGMRTGFEETAKVASAIHNRFLVRQFDAVVVTSRFAQREFGAAAASAGTPLHRIPLGVDLDDFTPAPVGGPVGGPVSCSTLELGRDVHDGVLRLVHVGRLSREKSPHLAVATAAELHRRGVRLRLDVFGEGPHLAELRAIAGGAPVVFHGHIAGRRALAERLAAADISLSVCPGETFGLAVLEALACGTPVVTADVGGASELIDAESGEKGCADPSSLADAVLRLAARSVNRRRAAARARAEQFPWQHAVDRMLDLHGSLDRTRPVEVRAG
ncbi:alpha-1,6-mannosyltransferase [Nocardioides daedukensis]|uniref:Alpha-1,6-mannosyltransferase n=1 Tax=Nocardioides daedukensis TaxID=634462 RepID=A0A7Y9S325_9ACTN|nr:glycosyltransferase [Nocardioides daedukensis]NYG58824.1 alpha-1,6-mannosyltransferase [Nocardioides daedukensis]